MNLKTQPQTQEQKQQNQRIILELLAKIAAAYPNFQLNEHSARVWLLSLKGTPRRLVAWAVDEHIRTSSYPPTIACIRKLALEELKNVRRKTKARQLELEIKQAQLPENIERREKVKTLIKQLGGSHDARTN